MAHVESYRVGDGSKRYRARWIVDGIGGSPHPGVVLIDDERIVDVIGPRSDGRLVLATHGGLFLMRPNGSPTPFARKPASVSWCSISIR